MKITVEPQTDIFLEGNLVCLKEDNSQVFLVTTVAQGYKDCDEDTFWAIDLTKFRISEGGFLKSLFQQFNGRIILEK